MQHTILLRCFGGVLVFAAVFLAAHFLPILKAELQRSENKLRRQGLLWFMPLARFFGPLWLLGVIVSLLLIGLQMAVQGQWFNG